MYDLELVEFEAPSKRFDESNGQITIHNSDPVLPQTLDGKVCPIGWASLALSSPLFSLLYHISSLSLLAVMFIDTIKF